MKRDLFVHTFFCVKLFAHYFVTYFVFPTNFSEFPTEKYFGKENPYQNLVASANPDDIKLDKYLYKNDQDLKRGILRK